MSEDFDRSIRACGALLKEFDYLFQAGSFSSLNSSGDFKRTARNSTNYSEVYDVGASNQQFNMMMSDMSFFQFYEKKEGCEVRLAYYPNPYQFLKYKENKVAALQLLDDGDITHDEYEQLLSESDFTCDIPVIRYDLSIGQYCEVFHPAAHLHVGFHAENRWPSRRQLSPYAFMLMILMHYYTQLWSRSGERDEHIHAKLDAEYRRAMSSCNLLNAHQFKKHEFERLYLS